ncbi:MAG TPA: DNA recombination protein RmuC [Candidatus Binataceae bacterium]|nr:DNA recombination protein RmuC [Candidatus Binataceae bacterium]
MAVYLLAGNFLLGVLALLILALYWSRLRSIAAASITEALKPLGDGIARLDQQLAHATADMAERIERTKGDLRQETADRMAGGFGGLRESIERQLSAGRDEQGRALAQATAQLEHRFTTLQSATENRLENLSARTGQSLDAIREQVDVKLLAITEQVQQKLDQNIKEGFAHFDKVQQHLRAAEEQLRNVGTIGASINDLNNLLKLPHLRGRFGEVSLERLLVDFLPAHMYELQSSHAQDAGGRPDAVIKFPERALPIDAKFPREAILPLFETSDPAELTKAREQFCRVIKEQAKRIAAYIQPENGTTDMALMYLPSETLYMEAVINGELSEWLNQRRVFPVSPNTLIVTLQAVAMVFKMYEFAKGYEKATEELKKAQKSFGFFEEKFDLVGKSLDKAQEAYSTAFRHLNTYRKRVNNIGGEAIGELESPGESAGGEEPPSTVVKLQQAG